MGEITRAYAEALTTSPGRMLTITIPELWADITVRGYIRVGLNKLKLADGVTVTEHEDRRWLSSTFTFKVTGPVLQLRPFLALLAYLEQ